MKITILFPFQAHQGGGNQFLLALRDQLVKKKMYTYSIADADIVLFNSHHAMLQVLKYRYMYPEKKFIHRMDGPVFTLRKTNRYTDDMIYLFNHISDATVFQSRWSKK